MTVNARSQVSRRTVFRYGAAAGVAAVAGPALTAGPAHSHGTPDVLPAPAPIPGGNTLPDGTVIHVFAPGPPEITLPYTGVRLEGLDVEPGVITDYSGFTAVAFHVGTATGSDGKRYNLETDMRVMDGRYVPLGGGPTRHGLFGFV
jgi:hypothetical protein